MQPFVARVIHDQRVAQGAGRATLITGDREFEMAPGPARQYSREMCSLSPGVASRHGKTRGLPARRMGNRRATACAGGAAMRKGRTRMDTLWKRHTIRRAVRDFLDGQGFIEIDCPLLVRGTTPDAVINSFRVGDKYLSTSTELQMRRLEVGGFDLLYTLTQNFREADGEGTTHNPEFTMLEWVRVGRDLRAVEKDTEQLSWRAHRQLGGEKTLHWQGNKVNLEPPWERMKMADIIAKFTGVPMPDFSLPSVQRAVEAAKLDCP